MLHNVGMKVRKNIVKIMLALENQCTLEEASVLERTWYNTVTRNGGVESAQMTISEFASEMGVRPEIGWSCDRICPWGGYEQANIRWASRATQGANKRVNHLQCGREGCMGLMQPRPGAGGRGNAVLYGWI